MIEAAPDNDEPGLRPLEVILLYCGDCGTVLGPYVAVGAEFTSGSGGAISGQAPQGAVPARSRRFPDELLTPVEMAEVPEDARVEVVFRDNGIIEGTAGGKELRLVGRLRSRRGPLTGTWGAVSVNADWRIGDNYRAPNPVPSTLTGHFGAEAVKLKGDFRLAPNYFFDKADIAGNLGDTPFLAVVSAVEGGLGSPKLAHRCDPRERSVRPCGFVSPRTLGPGTPDNADSGAERRNARSVSNSLGISSSAPLAWT
jgi:hypothetical protein